MASATRFLQFNPRTTRWMVAGFIWLLAIATAGCGHIPKTVDATKGQLPSDSEVALVKRGEIGIKGIYRVSDGAVVFDPERDTSFPYSMYLTIRLAPDEYRIWTQTCLRHQSFTGAVYGGGCAGFNRAFELEAGHVYKADSSFSLLRWMFDNTVTLRAWFEDQTTNEFLHETENTFSTK